MARHWFNAAAMMAAAFSLAPEATAQPRLQAPAGRWTLDYGDLRCSLARRLGGPESPVLILASYLGRDEPEFILMRDGRERLPDLPRRVRVVLSPSNHAAEGAVRSRRVEGGLIWTVQELGEGFIDRFAASEIVRIEVDGRPIVELRLPGATAAVTALRGCNTDLLNSWGVTPQSALTREAHQVSGTIRSDDYPPSAVGNEAQGVVVARFRVDPDGRARNCGAAVASGHLILDSATCQLVEERFRYEPALGPDGQPTASVLVRTVRWSLPD